MKPTAFVLLLGLSAFAVQAQPPAAAPEPAQPADEEVTVITAADADGHDTGCVRDTGTRLKKRDRKGCTGAPGESFSREEIDRTGAVDTADAIRKLSPRASVQRGN